MHIIFSSDFDGGAWPGPLSGRDASSGEAWVGPMGLLGALETSLGLGGPSTANALRAAAIVPTVRATEGFWSASAEVDPLAVAEKLLGWRDHLWMYGWRGRADGGRLEALARVTGGAPDGVADRIVAVMDALARRMPELSAIDLVDGEATLTPIWRAVLDRLRGHGVTVTQREFPTTRALGDLAASRLPEFRPVADGSLQLVRSAGPLAAADAVAAWLAAQDDLDGTVVIAPDETLDGALRRHGLPTTGGSTSGRDAALLQILPLVLALGWAPPDPSRALELLTLPVSPVPPGVARLLVRALHEWPAVGSDVWNAALETGLADIDASRRDAVRDRLAVFLAPTQTRPRFAVQEVRRRADALSAWLRSRQEREERDDEPWLAAIEQVSIFRSLLDGAQLDTVTESQILRLVDRATECVPTSTVHPAQAGIVAVGAPGAIAGPARRIVWWSFYRGTEASPKRIPLTGDERRALAEAGVVLPDLGREAVAAADRARRPLLAASQTLLLVSPRTDSGGTERHPDGLWDEIAGREAARGLIRRIERPEPFGPVAPVRKRRDVHETPRPRRAWAVAPDAIARRETESPSSVALLVGCSFRWTLEYPAEVRGGATAALPESEQLLGRVVHELLARTLHGELLPPDDARAAAERLFDDEAPRLAAALFLPGADRELALARRAVGLAARALAGHLRDTNSVVVEVETPHRMDAFGTAFEGRPDMVLGPAPRVVDFKWGGRGWRADQLRSDSAHQLAAYAALLRGPGAWPAVAYFILRDQSLLTTDAAAFPGTAVVGGGTPEATWRALVAAHAERWASVAAGRLEAPGNPDDAGEGVAKKDGILDGRLVLAPPCQWCDYGALCGRPSGSAE